MRSLHGCSLISYGMHSATIIGNAGRKWQHGIGKEGNPATQAKPYGSKFIMNHLRLFFKPIVTSLNICRKPLWSYCLKMWHNQAEITIRKFSISGTAMKQCRAYS